MHIKDPERLPVAGREREKQQIARAKSPKRVENCIYIQDPENMQPIDLK